MVCCAYWNTLLLLIQFRKKCELVRCCSDCLNYKCNSTYVSNIDNHKKLPPTIDTSPYKYQQCKRTRKLESRVKARPPVIPKRETGVEQVRREEVPRGAPLLEASTRRKTSFSPSRASTFLVYNNKRGVRALETCDAREKKIYRAFVTTSRVNPATVYRSSCTRSTLNDIKLGGSFKNTLHFGNFGEIHCSRDRSSSMSSMLHRTTKCR